MDDRVDPAAAENPVERVLVAYVGLDEADAVGDRPGIAGREIVEHHDLLAGVDQGQHHVAADEPRAARHQCRHAENLRLVWKRTITSGLYGW